MKPTRIVLFALLALLCSDQGSGYGVRWVPADSPIPLPLLGLTCRIR